MYPRIGPVPTYSIFYILSILSHFLMCYFIARRLGLRRRVWIVVGICYMEGMIVGAKILYDIQNAQFDLRALLSIRHYMQGGVWGGLLAYFILALPLALFLAKNKRAAFDLVAMSIPIPWIFTKLGCLFNGCCYGKASSLPWAITFPEGARGAPANISLHPTQIYEILVVVCILIVFKKLKYEKWRGAMLLWFLALYGTGRAATEFFRGDFDHHLFVGPLTLSQLICLIAAGASITLLFLWRYFVRNDILDESMTI
ncbi:MAG: prolipoprotein diacylglyceryl transferase [Planctomycetes bacterium]|nr:prolipoprotein diacylglyceryl transferase [Planctomycetota bacterium]